MLAKYCLSSLALPALCCNAAAMSAGRPDCEEVQFTYNITSSLFCKAPNHKKQSFPLQVLAHGSSYTKEYWNRASWGNMTVENSWQQFAYEKGYSTLAIDRLCYGASSHPDPLLDCQLTTSIEIFHTLFGALKNGTASPRIPIPTELAFVGHSAGSITVSNFVEAYPNDVDTAILTSWPSGPIANIGAAEYYSSHNPNPHSTSDSAEPACLRAWRNRFPSTFPGPRSRLNCQPERKPKANRLHTFPLGEATYTGVLSFPAFRGKVIVATGELDSFAHADLDVIARTRGRFPSASSFGWVKGTQSGHLVNYHRSAHQTYQKVFALLRNREIEEVQFNSRLQLLNRRNSACITRVRNAEPAGSEYESFRERKNEKNEQRKEAFRVLSTAQQASL
ncbi:MAG: hypothetical protein LQ339_002392 [Xanthoria mediterranea]|nr:MAG: hypothetical protein LQ339_002392 [Xanthoria mediterranea]